MARVTVQARYTLRLSDDEMATVITALEQDGGDAAQAILTDLGFEDTTAPEAGPPEPAEESAEGVAPRARPLLAWRRHA